MRTITIFAAMALAIALSGCVTSGPYASATPAGQPAHFVMVDRFSGTMRPCGPDRHVCLEMIRDDTDRQRGN